MREIKDVYLTNETYAALRAELTRLIEQPDVHDADTKVVSALGEVAGIWPEAIKEDAEGFEFTSDCNRMELNVSNADPAITRKSANKRPCSVIRGFKAL